MTSPSPTKTELRRSMRALLEKRDAAAIRKDSGKIIIRLMDDRSLWPASGAVGLFGGLPGEPDLLPLIAWIRGKNLVPVFFEMADDRLVPRSVTCTDDLVKGERGILLPGEHCPEVPLELLKTILVPGLAFGKKDLTRLGRGKGHYDQLLATDRIQARLIGICWHEQLQAKIPVEGHDRSMDIIVTERDTLS
jgi:5-formyltetrahydrofolate cyclo-ligase